MYWLARQCFFIHEWFTSTSSFWSAANSATTGFPSITNFLHISASTSPAFQKFFFSNSALIVLFWLSRWCTTWKGKQTMEQQPQRACEQTKGKQRQNQVTSHSNWPRALLFDLDHKQCNDIIKGWLHCLTSESKERFLVNYMLMFGLAWCLVRPITSYFCFPSPPPSKWTSCMYCRLVTIVKRNHDNNNRKRKQKSYEKPSTHPI